MVDKSAATSRHDFAHVRGHDPTEERAGIAPISTNSNHRASPVSFFAFCKVERPDSGDPVRGRK